MTALTFRPSFLFFPLSFHPRSSYSYIVLTRNDLRLSASSHLFPILLFFLNIFFLLKRLLLDFFCTSFSIFPSITSSITLFSLHSPLLLPVFPFFINLLLPILLSLRFLLQSHFLPIWPRSLLRYILVSTLISLFFSPFLPPCTSDRDTRCLLGGICKTRSLPRNQSDWVA